MTHVLSHETSLLERRVLVGLNNCMKWFSFFNLKLDEENGVSYDWEDMRRHFRSETNLGK